MRKAELVITSSPNDDALIGYCSACILVKFRIKGNALRQKELLRVLFDRHFERAHSHEPTGSHDPPRPNDGK